MKNNHRILITGVAGFIGSKICRELLKYDYSIIGIDDLSSGNKKNIPKNITFFKFDLSNYKNFNRIPKCKYILHLAGQSSGDMSFDDPVADLKKNTQSTLNLIKFGISSNAKRIIYASSMSIYGDLNKVKYNENLIPSPKSCYGISKLASENYLKVFSKKLNYIIFRMFNIYGPGQDLRNLRQGMVSIYLAQALKNKKIIVKGSLERVRDFVYIDDVVKIWVKAINKNIVNQTINICLGDSITVKKLLREIQLLIPQTKIIKESSTRGDQIRSVGDSKKLKKNFKLKFTNLKTGLSQFIKSI
ncbi:NAD-dependent epimerase/dehydratase family protein [Candidatus Pelagibacter sp.]|nr:NAD-dependent epimerase/dehydratase family protein [Candidatus Pelagibacter sp.]